MLMQAPGLPDFGAMTSPCAADLCRPVVTITPADTNATVRELFDRHRDLVSLPVVDGARPLGLIKRHTFQSEMAKPFRKELHERKSCVAFMDAAPLVVEAETSIERTAGLVADSATNALADGFLVVRDGAYVGVALGLDLMRMVADLQEAKNRQIMQSIDYASLIQRAMLRTSQDALAAAMPEAAIAWEPRDTVGGDFFYVAAHDDGVFVALADCTGHGVPGAFMTLISSSWLAQALERDGPRDPARLLGALNQRIKLALGQTAARRIGEESDDGLDALLLWFDRASRSLTYAGARIPLHVLDAAGQASTHDSDRMGVGYVDTPLQHAWQNRHVALQPGDLVCAVTDGFTDQIGGERRIAFGKRRLRDLLAARGTAPASAHVDGLLGAHRDYQGRHRRRDDLTVFATRFLRESA